MCKAKEYIEQMKNVSDSIDKTRKELQKKLKQLEAIQQDVLHIIEKYVGTN